MPLAPDRRPNIRGGTTSARTMPTAMAAKASGMASRRPRSALSRPTPSVFSTCTAMSGNGSRTVGTRIARGHRKTAVRGLAPPTMVGGWCAAGPGTSIRTACARPAAAGSTPSTGSTLWGSGSAGRLPLKSLLLYLRGPGQSPWSGFFGNGSMTDSSKRTGPAAEAHYQFLTRLMPSSMPQRRGGAESEFTVRGAYTRFRAHAAARRTRQGGARTCATYCPKPTS
jgi:hypothetical protein